MADIASLSLEVKSDQVKQATAAMREMVPAASAAERAAEKWGMTTSAAARSTEDFSKRVQGTIKNLEFERQQLTRNAAEQAKHSALRRAGVSAASAEGQAIAASVAALQAQRAALGQTSLAAKAFSSVWGQVKSLLIGFSLISIASGLIQMGKAAFEAASGLEELAEQLGISAKLFQSLQYQAVQSGVKTEQLEVGLGKFSQKMGEAADGSKEIIDSLQKLGVKNLDLQGNLRPTEDLLTEVARGIMAIDDPARRSAAAVDFFGKAGIRLLPLLSEIAKGADAMGASADSAGALISEEVIKKLDKIADRLERSKLEWRKFFADNIAEGVDWADKIILLHQLVFSKAGAGIAKWASDFSGWLTGIVDGFNVAGVRGVAQFLAAFGELPDQLGKLFTDGMNKAIDAVDGGLNRIVKAFSDKAPWLGIQGKGFTIPHLEGGGASLTDMSGAIVAAGDAAVAPLLERQAAARAATAQRALINRQAGMQDDAARAGPGGKLPANLLGGTSTKGAGTSAVKDAGKAAEESYRKLVAGADQYIAMKKIETQAIGMNAEAAARLKHEQELLGKAVNDNLKLDATQIANLKAKAAAMAQADSAFKAATFLDDVKTKTDEFVAAQELERSALFMTAEAADALRFSNEMLNKAKQDGIDQMPGVVDAINASAVAMAAAKRQTDETKAAFDFAKDTFQGFFVDMRKDLMDGQTVWDSFGNAAMNALDKISSKLLDIATAKLFEGAFGSGGAGSSGGALGGLVGMIGSSLGNYFGGATLAKGGVLHHGNLVPFANGGIVNRPTLFPMANGAGLMGEAGPEAIMPLKRGRGGRLGVVVDRGQSSDGAIVVNIKTTNQIGSVVSRAEMEQQITMAEERTRKAAIAGVLDAKSRGGAYRAGLRR